MRSLVLCSSKKKKKQKKKLFSYIQNIFYSETYIPQSKAKATILLLLLISYLFKWYPALIALK